jgi:thioredoxin 1
VVLELWRPGCHYCKAMEPVIAKLSDELKDKVKFVKMNTSENSKVPSTFTYPGVPAFFYIKDGKTVSSTIGAMEGADLKKDLGIQ